MSLVVVPGMPYLLPAFINGPTSSIITFNATLPVGRLSMPPNRHRGHHRLSTEVYTLILLRNQYLTQRTQKAGGCDFYAKAKLNRGITT